MIERKIENTAQSPRKKENNNAGGGFVDRVKSFQQRLMIKLTLLGILGGPLQVQAEEGKTKDKTIDPTEATPPSGESVLGKGTFILKTSTEHGEKSLNGGLEFSPAEFDYENLTPENREAILKKRNLNVVVVTTQSAMEVVEEINGDFKEGTENLMKPVEEFFKNCGADVKCNVYADNIIHLPASEYYDEEKKSGKDAIAYLNNSMEPGGYLDLELTRLAEEEGVPREKLFPIFYIKHNNGGGGAFTNFTGHGFAIVTDQAFNPYNYPYREDWINGVGPHEIVKMFGLETSTQTAESSRKGFIWQVPTDENGELLYDFREEASDPLPITEISTMSIAYKTGRRQINRTSENGLSVRLFDHKSQQYIPIPLGDPEHDAWHHGDWTRMDFFTHERSGTSVGDLELPLDNLTIYPNPSTGPINIRGLNNPTQERVRCVLFDATGRVVHAENFDHATEEVSFSPRIAAGMYILRVIKGGKILSSEQIVRQ